MLEAAAAGARNVGYPEGSGRRAGMGILMPCALRRRGAEATRAYKTAAAAGVAPTTPAVL